jgi:hypothetical protein
MWGKKKPDTSQAVAPEPKKLLTNKKSTDAMRPLDATADRATGWLGSILCLAKMERVSEVLQFSVIIE